MAWDADACASWAEIMHARVERLGINTLYFVLLIIMMINGYVYRVRYTIIFSHPPCPFGLPLFIPIFTLQLEPTGQSR